MRTGGFDNQRQVLEDEARRRVSRRAFLVGSVGCVAAGLAGGIALTLFSGQSAAAEGETLNPQKVLDPELEWAQQMASGPLANLMKHYAFYLYLVDVHGQNHPWLWGGVQRICRTTANDMDAVMATRLLETLNAAAHPAALDEHRPILERIRGKQK